MENDRRNHFMINLHERMGPGPRIASLKESSVLDDLISSRFLDDGLLSSRDCVSGILLF